MLDRKAKSFEEREQEYEKAKRRIFKDMNSESIEQFWNNWHSGEAINVNPTNKNNGKNCTDSGADDDRPEPPSHGHRAQVKMHGHIDCLSSSQ